MMWQKECGVCIKKIINIQHRIYLYTVHENSPPFLEQRHKRAEKTMHDKKKNKYLLLQK